MKQLVMEFFSIVGILVVNGKAWSAVAKSNPNDLNGRSKKIYGCEAPRIMTIIATGGWWNNMYCIYGNGSENGNALKLL